MCRAWQQISSQLQHLNFECIRLHLSKSSTDLFQTKEPGSLAVHIKRVLQSPRSSVILFRIHYCKIFVENLQFCIGHKTTGTTLTSSKCHNDFSKSFLCSVEPASPHPLGIFSVCNDKA